MKIGLWISNPRNKELIFEWIGTKYDTMEIKRYSDINEDLDLIIVDGLMFKENRDRIKARKEVESPLFLPVLLITNREDIKFVTSQLWIVVDEIILTPIEKVELAARIEVLLRARKLSLQCYEMLNTDPLTGLYNRRHFFKMTEIEISKLNRNKRPASCIMMDIDFFKKVNDTYGHIAGDKVLIEVGKKIREGVRDYDIVARFGGEEFIVFLPETQLKEAFSVAERIRSNIMEYPIEINEEVKVPITVSAGVSTSQNKDIILHELIKEADKALYLAKNSGRNRVCF